ncbi:hypothetical protein NEF87_000974 [Candidatus Lokiarchaeum ossiferum]|uniref:Uncharacterized protein n=1 Tax=Candidatus Lokiarchaeum ossiferum TaxID=2951803 RepID=A0ABY6HQ38_9ARCH|nr:hypothetical protein NEF87_000974 [Candidatus Lokiarchaeum sp. B-35]
MCLLLRKENNQNSNDLTCYDESSHWDEIEELDDFVVESLLEEEIREFKKLVRLQKIIEINKRKPQYYI